MQQNEKRICIKCKENKATIVLKENYCKICFLNYVEHAFKMTLKVKCGMTHKKMKILICLSNGQNSLGLAQLTSDVMYSTCQYNKNKMFFNAEVLHINENNYPSSIKQISETLKFPYNELNLLEFCPHLEEIKANLINSGSSCHDFIRFLRLHMIYKYAADKEYSLICFASNGQRLSANLLSNLSKGRGLGIDTQISFLNTLEYPSAFFLSQSQEPFLRLHIAHPMRELLNKDILYYLHCKGLDHQQTNIQQQFKDNSTRKSNIDQLLQDFVDKIQVGFSSTTFTVLHTADKVQSKPLPVTYCPICLCQRDKIYNQLEYETLDNSNKALIARLENNTKFYSKICYSCKRIFQFAQNPDDLYNFKNFPNQISDIAALI